MPKTAKTALKSYLPPAPYPVSTNTAPLPALAMAAIPPAPTQHVTGDERHGSGSWSAHSDDILMQARQRGLNWQPIASQYFPNKTANACRKRHERLMEKRNHENDWDGVKLDILAKNYMDVREQMWKILADVLGEKWQTVEAKCMEKGLKTLQTANRSFHRRERQCGNSDAEYDEFSDTRYQPPQGRDRSKSRQGDGDEFNDSAIGPDADQPFLTNKQNDHPRSYASSQRSYPSSVHNEQAPFSGGAITPPYSSTARSFSISSSTTFTPTMPAASSYHPVQQPSPSPYQQTLPSFSSAFGVPGLNSVLHPPSSSHQLHTVTSQ